MKKAANILFTISAVLSIVCAVSFFICSIVFFAMAGSTPVVEEMIANGQIQVPEEFDASTYVPVVIGIFSGLATFFLVAGGCAIAEAIFSFKSRHCERKVFFILSIVFGVLSDTWVGVVAGIFALIKGDTVE